MSRVSIELIASALVLAPIAPLVGSLTIPATAASWLAFGNVAVIAGVGSPLLLFIWIAQRGATGASSLPFVVPSITAGFGVAALGMWLARAQVSRASTSGALREGMTVARLDAR